VTIDTNHMTAATVCCYGLSTDQPIGSIMSTLIMDEDDDCSSLTGLSHVRGFTEDEAMLDESAARIARLREERSRKAASRSTTSGSSTTTTGTGTESVEPAEPPPPPKRRSHSQKIFPLNCSPTSSHVSLNQTVIDR